MGKPVLRKIVFVIVAALALPLVAATAASADVQYPPTGEGSTVPARQERAPRDAAPAAVRAPLARTGSDLAVLGGVAVVLMAGGAVVLVASRRRVTTSPA